MRDRKRQSSASHNKGHKKLSREGPKARLPEAKAKQGGLAEKPLKGSRARQEETTGTDNVRDSSILNPKMSRKLRVCGRGNVVSKATNKGRPNNRILDVCSSHEGTEQRSELTLKQI